VVKKYDTKEQMLGAEGANAMRQVERFVMLETVDRQWKDHLYSLDHLKEGIGLRGYGQRDPLVEYKKESFSLFQSMRERVDEEVLRYLWRLRPVLTDASGAPARPAQPARRAAPAVTENRPAVPAFAGAFRGGSPAAAPPRPARVGGDDAPVRTVRREEPKVGRNDPCPCGSGKKYKKCHGAQ
jgi:preprotein translocase subunit SecA